MTKTLLLCIAANGWIESIQNNSSVLDGRTVMNKFSVP